MAKITIVDSAGGSFPKQKAELQFGNLIVTTANRGQKRYQIKDSIKTLTIISEYKNSSIFDIVLVDGSCFRGEADKKIVHQWMLHTGQSVNDPVHVQGESGTTASKSASTPTGVTTLTPEQVSEQKIITTLVAIIVVIVFLILYKLGSSNIPLTAEEKKWSAVVYCQDLVKDSLKAPKTAEFPWATQAIEGGGGLYTVASYVDAENAFGAKLRTNFLCILQYNGSGWKVESLNLQTQ